MKKYKFTISGQTYEVEIGEFDGINATVYVNGSPYEVEVQNDVKKAKTPVIPRKIVETKIPEGQAKKSVSEGATFKIVSPLPGTIKKVSVSVGSTIKEGECIMIMEAMKMDNNIMTERGGVVKTINVKEGDSVLQGDTLIEITL